MIEKILLEHYYQYPLMRTQDFFKLLYQGEFGGAHACDISQQNILTQIQNEINHIDEPCETITVAQIISSTQSRVNLVPFCEQNQNLETLAEMFLISAKSSLGSEENLEKKISVFESLVKEKQILLPYLSVKSSAIKYLADLKPLSHSSTYKLNYNPHYRVVRREFFDIFPIINRINSILHKKTICVAIDGNSGSGKSYYANALKKYYGQICNVFHADDFFLPVNMRTDERLSEIGGNIHYERLTKLLEDISKNNNFTYEKYNCQTNAYTKEFAIPKQLNIVEGVYSAHPNLAKKYDIIVKFGVNYHTQQKRLLGRSGEEILEKYNKIWLPLEDKYFENYSFQNAINIVTDDKDLHTQDFNL
ncbi:MAG TPA: hypothetical protein PK675_03845 [Clostridia bacterium]|nr:hypothetical protein [Clostridia bacterium]